MSIITVVVLCAAVWAIRWLARHTHTFTTMREVNLSITDVQVDPRRSNVILAWRGHDPEPQPFRTFPHEVKAVTNVALVDRNGKGDNIVVAGVGRTWDGNCLFAFDLEGEPIGEWNLSPGEYMDWPDCGPSTNWLVRLIEIGDLDGEPGEEIVVVANDEMEYPARI